ncbi:ABC transporter permease subunit, partial [Streptococcus pyogenes]
GSIYALVALGFNIIFKSTDAINFTQGEWVMVGGVLGATIYATNLLPLWAALLIAVVVVGAVGIVSERLVVAPLRTPSPMLV